MAKNIVDGIGAINISDHNKMLDDVEGALLKPFNDDRRCEFEDFVWHRANSLKVLHASIEFLEVISDSKIVHREMLTKLLLLCGENIDPSMPWTGPEHVSSSYRILGLLKKLFGFDSTSKFLLDKNGTVLRRCLEDMRPKVEAKDMCRVHPGAKACFVWLLHHVIHPNLGSYLSEFFPYTLRFLDDWEPRNKLVGVQCLRHIVSNVSPTQLTWFGRYQLSCDALQKAFVGQQDVNLLKEVCVCWFALLEKVEKKDDNGKPNGWDELANHYFYKMEIATDTEVKKVLSEKFGLLLKHLDKSLPRWLTITLRVIASYSEEINEVEVRVAVIKALGMIIELQPDRAEFHLKEILDILIRVMYEVTFKSDSQEVSVEARQCFLKSAESFPKRFRHLCHGMDDLKVNEEFDAVVKKAFELSEI